MLMCTLTARQLYIFFQPMGDKQLSGEERHTQSKSNEASGSDKRKYKKSTPSTSEASESQGSRILSNLAVEELF
jgi:hypothetical protein